MIRDTKTCLRRSVWSQRHERKAVFSSELKRCNIYEVVVAYTVVAWLIVQAASILLPTFDAQVRGMNGVVRLVRLGFPAALVFSWAFEMIPTSQ